MSKKGITKKISQRFFFAIVLLGVFSIFSFGVYFSTVKIFGFDYFMIHQSTQQRFFSQQITILTQHLVSEKDSSRLKALKNELDSVISEMEKGHHYLAHNPEASGNFHSDEIMSIYFATPVYLDKKIHSFISAARVLSSSSANARTKYAEIIFSTSTPLLFDLDLIVQQYQIENHSEKNRLLWTRSIVLLIMLILLFLIWLFVFKPATKELRYYLSEIIKKDNDLLQANIDLEQKVEERSLKIREKENTYRMLVEHMNEGLAYYNPDGIFTFVNDKFCEILGYKKEELINQPILIIFFQEDIGKIKQKIEERKKGIKEQYEWKLPTKNGGKIWAYISSTPIYENDKVTGSLLVFTNITQRKETELSLAELHQFNGILLNTIPLGMQVVDIEGNVLYSNQKMSELAGFDTRGKKCWTVVHDEKIPCSNCLRSFGIEQGKLNVCEMQKVFDGKIVHIYQAGINFHQTRAVLELFIDVTMLKEAEQQLIFKNKELQTFITRASHDMRSPVANILGLIYFLKKESSSVDNKLFDYIEQSAMKMDKILIELINIGKVYNNSVNISTVSLKEVTEEIIKNLETNEDFYSVKFMAEIKAGIFFQSDRSMVVTILHNLMDNAARYRKLNNGESVVSVKIENLNNGIRIQVSDNGTGMTSVVQERAFEMFFRGSYESIGTGLGLYMVKTFVEKLGGSIRLKSEQEAGTVVTVILPNLSQKSLERIV